jgi:uncharacterized SAM-binding protein YcdF (DUF218 family)
MNPGQHGGIIFRFLSLLCLVAFLGGIYVVRHPLLRLAGSFWVVQDPLDHADAIVVLGDDNLAGDRAARAAELFRAGWAPEVVAGGRMLRPYFSVSELIERDLESRGVPPSAVVRLDLHGNDSREDAEALRRLALERSWRRLLVVTANYHTRRIRYVFRKIFRPDVSVGMVAVDDASFNPENWWESTEGREIFWREALNYCVARWELRDDGSGSAPAQIPAEIPAGHVPAQSVEPNASQPSARASGG